MNCRHCGSSLSQSVINLGHQPPSNAYLTQESLLLPETYYPLEVYICTHCWLVQVPEHLPAESLFTADYAYFSSTSSSWCQHALEFVEESITRLELDSSSFVLEIASNDGYLLKNYVSRSIPCLGIEPTKTTADYATRIGVPTLQEFFSTPLAEALVSSHPSLTRKADLIIANNVLAHVPDINDFVKAISILLKPNGRVSIEFPHLLRLIQNNQFDTIYHEHYSYLSLRVVQRIFHSVGLTVEDVQTLPTHGGSLRVWLCHSGLCQPTSSVSRILELEANFNLESLSVYSNFQQQAESIKHRLLSFLLDLRAKGIPVVAYGAAAKGNTLLNYAGVGTDLLPRVYDNAASKQNKYLPGSHIPILKPDPSLIQYDGYLVLLPWNLYNEVSSLYPHATIITFSPELTIYPPRLR